ncbi:LysR family transcriptional regulator [Agrobacterium rhizogenes]|uniref:HTH-type transcriptional regulator TtuA n=5 Tax=Rhizobium/Agrobacterium group TaxID=227290 RepID=A0A2Z2PVD7_RHIRH|nr:MULTISPECIES: LysR family transcriptional regulator [Rhizobium/Agrobacterium group]AYD04995.1 LysR family transcriptional regulator [Neorhizobium sp. NCHU2750]OCJ28629.1 LysR family transcriptional regulator [Agrobacterium sp. B133/95]ASK44859.1 LysR family transcriptional regulator [Rhizobium rhizogenes]ASK44936.1 LysR family transcriptional regulator [Rhizobium rhizogenes]ASK45537.1 LysR family transcriptional regulator [Agrobacterium radiobacter]
MNLDDIEAFIAVVGARSLSQAAAILSLTQSAISKRIQNLEKDLGVTLLDRSVKPPVPTTVGLGVHEQCLNILKEVDKLRLTLSARSNLTGGARLGLTQAVCDVILADIVHLQRERWPELSIRATTGWANQIVEKLVDGQIDAAIVLMPTRKIFPHKVTAVSLAQVEMAIVGPLGSGGDRAQRLGTLHKSGWILNPDGCGFRAELQRAHAALNLPFKVNLDTFARETQLEMVAAGLGLGLVPVPLLEMSPHRTKLEIITVSDFSLRAELWLCHAPTLGALEPPISAFGARAATLFQGAAAPSRLVDFEAANQTITS